MLGWGRTTSGREAVAHRHAKIGVRIALVLGIALGGSFALPTYLLVTYQTRLERSAARAAFVLASSDLGRQASVPKSASPWACLCSVRASDARSAGIKARRSPGATASGAVRSR